MYNCNEVYFKSREVAAYRLLDVLPLDLIKLDEWIVISSSLGGYKIARILARELNSKCYMMFSSKIYAPNNEECEIAVVTEHQEVLIHEELVNAFNINVDYIYSQSEIEYKNNILPAVQQFRGGKSIEDLKDKNVLLVDEGINSSLTMMACIKTVVNLEAKSVSVATPILPTASIPIIESIADDLYYIKNLDHFVSIDFYYDELEDVSLEDAEKLKKEI